MKQFTKINHIEIGGTLFPAEYINSMLVIDYPNHNPELAEKITEEERKLFEELKEFTSKFIKENNIKFDFNEKNN